MAKFIFWASQVWNLQPDAKTKVLFEFHIKRSTSNVYMFVCSNVLQFNQSFCNQSIYNIVFLWLPLHHCLWPNLLCNTANVTHAASRHSNSYRFIQKSRRCVQKSYFVAQKSIRVILYSNNAVYKFFHIIQKSCHAIWKPSAVIQKLHHVTHNAHYGIQKSRSRN